MARQLHILNGDSTAERFENSGLTGILAVCREFFCDGPLENEVGSDLFWKKRYAFFEKEFDIEKIEYFDTTIKEFLKFEVIDGYKEVVLWFEYDLFCQVNMLAVCAFLLKNYKKDMFYYLVCTGTSNESTRMLTLADYSAEEYQNLYINKVKLTRHDLEFARACWSVFVNNDQKEMKSFDFGKGKKFQYLKGAFKQQLERFPKNNGYNQIELIILESIAISPKTSNEIISGLLNWQQLNTVYGFGDLQYFWYLKKLKKLYTISDSRYYLNELGMKLVKDGDS